MKFISTILIFAVCTISLSACAEVVTELIEYQHGDVSLEGYLAYDDSVDEKRPGIIIVHEWNGLGDFIKEKTRLLAGMGYVAFAIDMYGKGVRPKNSEESAEQASIYRSDRRLMRDRAAAGFSVLKNHPLVKQNQIAAIGYCFGGGVVLELVRSGADISGVVSFHGNLDTPDPTDAQVIKARVLVLHGADDPHVPREQVDAFISEMQQAGVDWQMVLYGNSVHSFTNPKHSTDPSGGVAYNERSAHNAWNQMKLFFDELFQ